MLYYFRFVYTYIDRTLVYSESEEKHLHLDILFKCMRDNQININVTESIFREPGLSFLGYHIFTDGIRPLSDRVRTIQNYVLSKTVGDLRRFISLVDYYSRPLARTASSLQILFNKTKEATNNDSTSLTRNEEEEKAFQKLKQDSVNATF